jgi:hypothetical protein
VEYRLDSPRAADIESASRDLSSTSAPGLLRERPLGIEQRREFWHLLALGGDWYNIRFLRLVVHLEGSLHRRSLLLSDLTQTRLASSVRSPFLLTMFRAHPGRVVC